ncbi:dicarboxylate/amino acid:cation symporter, partial [Halochromatium sp.]
MAWRALYSTPTGLALGVLLALLWPAGAAWVGWLGDVFLSLLKVLILPLILVSIYAALARGVDLARLGGRTLGFYLLTSALAAVTGTLLGLLFSRAIEPGLLNLEPVASGGEVFGAGFSLERLIANLVPSNLFASLAEGNILHIVVLAIFAALAARGLEPKPRRLLADGAEAVNALLMRMLAILLALAPIGIAALVYASLASMDWAAVLALRPFVWAVALAAALHTLLFLPTLLWLGSGRHPWRFFIQVRAALTTALATASSAATYPVSKQTLERNAGVSPGTT